MHTSVHVCACWGIFSYLFELLYSEGLTLWPPTLLFGLFNPKIKVNNNNFECNMKLVMFIKFFRSSASVIQTFVFVLMFCVRDLCHSSFSWILVSFRKGSYRCIYESEPLPSLGTKIRFMVFFFNFELLVAEFAVPWLWIF